MYKYVKSWFISSDDMKKKKKEKKFQKKKKATPSFSHVAIENAPKEKSQKQKRQLKSYKDAVKTISL